jgi:uncharacterized protein (DUF1778 family)
LCQHCVDPAQQQQINIRYDPEIEEVQMKANSSPEYTARINLHTTPSQRDAIQAAAKRNLNSINDWIRRALQVQLARDELKTMRQPHAPR